MQTQTPPIGGIQPPFEKPLSLHSKKQFGPHIPPDELADVLELDELADVLELDELADVLELDELADVLELDELADVLELDELADVSPELADDSEFVPESGAPPAPCAPKLISSPPQQSNTIGKSKVSFLSMKVSSGLSRFSSRQLSI